MNGVSLSKGARIGLRLALVVIAVVTASLIVFWPWKTAPSLPSPDDVDPPTSESLDPDDGTRAALGVSSPVNADDAIRGRVLSLDRIQAPEHAADIATSAAVASLLQDYSQLEGIMRRLGGDYALTEREYEFNRRWLRSLSPSSRPEIAAGMTQREWEAWVDDATISELIQHNNDDTLSPVRTVARGRIQSHAIDVLDATALRSMEETIRTIARQVGIGDADTAQIVGFRGRLRYHPVDTGEPPPSQFFVVYVPGVTTDDREFVAVYIFAHRAPTGWFPYFVRSLSRYSQSTPPQRRIPFVPAF